MSLYFLQSLWEIWESSCPDQTADKTGQPGNLVGSMASWVERRDFWREEGKEEQGSSGCGPQDIFGTPSVLELGQA